MSRGRNKRQELFALERQFEEWWAIRCATDSEQDCIAEDDRIIKFFPRAGGASILKAGAWK